MTPLLLLVAGFGLLEASLRLYGYDPLGQVLDGRSYFLRPSRHPDLDYEPVPGVVGFNWGTQILINSYGFRDADYPVERRPGVPRLVVLGDSIAFGSDLVAGRSFPDLLEPHFESIGRQVEVLNLAVPGYDTLNEVAFFEQVGAEFSPDIVVVAFCINDLGTHSVDLTLMRILQDYGAAVRHSRALQFLTSRLDRVQQRLETEFEVGESEEEFRAANKGHIVPVRDDPEVRRIAGQLLRSGAAPSYPFLPWYLSEERLGRLRYSFERLAALSRRHGFEVVVLLIPFLDDEGHPDAYRSAYDLVRHEARRAGFRTTDATETFQARGFEALMQRNMGLADVVHPNEEGHRLLAEHLAAALPW